MTHTLGPWTVDGIIVHESNGQYVARIHHPDRSNNQIREIARLIGAAPDLLEALYEIAGDLADPPRNPEELIARDAITKATKGD